MVAPLLVPINKTDDGRWSIPSPVRGKDPIIESTAHLALRTANSIYRLNPNEYPFPVMPFLNDPEYITPILKIQSPDRSQFFRPIFNVLSFKDPLRDNTFIFFGETLTDREVLLVTSGFVETEDKQQLVGMWRLDESRSFESLYKQRLARSKERNQSIPKAKDLYIVERRVGEEWRMVKNVGENGFFALRLTADLQAKALSAENHDVYRSRKFDSFSAKTTSTYRP